MYVNGTGILGGWIKEERIFLLGGLLPHFLWCFRLPSLRVDFWDCLAPSPLPTSCGVFEGKLLGHSSSFPSSCGGLDYSL